MCFEKLHLIEPTSERYHGGVIWKCRCDCGKIVYRQYSKVISRLVRSCGCLRGKCKSRDPKLEKGTYKRSDGYIRKLARDNPNADYDGYVFEHRLVMENKIKRYLEPMEVVHHINGLRDDNRLENLILFPDNGAHIAHHLREKRMLKATKGNKDLSAKTYDFT